MKRERQRWRAVLNPTRWRRTLLRRLIVLFILFILSYRRRVNTLHGLHVYSALGRELKTRSEGLGVIILTAYTINYEELFLNLICNLQRFGLEKSLLGVTLDEEAKESAKANNLHTFHVTDFNILESSLRMRKIDKYGSHAYNAATKLKSRIVLYTLKQGITVIWTDVDVVWLQNPVKMLLPYLEYVDIAIQSDSPLLGGNPNNFLNSGLYAVRARRVTVAAFSMIQKHSAQSNHSEQPSFNKVLCEHPTGIRVGEMDCAMRSNYFTWFFGGKRVKVRVLPTNTYMNGALGFVIRMAQNLEANQTAHAIRMKILKSPDPIAFHNNYIVGFERKVERQALLGYWYLGACTVA